MGKTHKFSQYVTEAARPPFVLEVSDDEILEIEAPDGDTMLEIEEARSSRASLELLSGKHADRVIELVGPVAAGVMTNLVQDMLKHFGITPEQAPPGGSRASRRS